jgi:cytidylate kinase
MASRPVSMPAMKRIAVFGNAGGGKSRLARRLAEAMSLPLYCLDLIQFRAGRYWPGSSLFQVGRASSTPPAMR